VHGTQITFKEGREQTVKHNFLPVTNITRKTAKNMLPPSYHPSFAPSVAMPSDNDIAAATIRITRVKS